MQGKKPNLSRMALAVALALPLAAQAIVVQFSAQLDGASVRPDPVPSDAQGVATLFYDTELEQFDFALAATGLSSQVTEAYLHAPATSEQVAPIQVGVHIVGVWFTLNQSGDTLQISGFDYPNPGVWNPDGPPRMSLNEALQQGLVYASVRTTAYPQGEIRGQFIPMVPIPEPATWAMMALGLAAVGGVAARRRS